MGLARFKNGVPDSPLNFIFDYASFWTNYDAEKNLRLLGRGWSALLGCEIRFRMVLARWWGILGLALLGTSRRSPALLGQAIRLDVDFERYPES